jgi:pyruvate/2-oxoglutarate/acetoin dehydrogenase E1 component
VSWGSITRKAEEAAERAAQRGISAEIIETQWLNPFDLGSVLGSIAKTRRLLVVHEANIQGGFGGEVIAQVAASGVRLIAPPARVGLANMRIPAAPALADAILPSADSIYREISSLVGEAVPA